MMTAGQISTGYGTRIAAITAIAIVGSMLACFPSGSVWVAMIALVVIGGASLALSRALCGPSKACSMIIIGTWTLLGVGYALNMWWFTTEAGVTPECPALLNDDAATVWQRMAEYRQGIPAEDIRSYGYAIFLCHIIPSWAPQLMSIMTLNIACTLLCVILAGATAQRAVAATAACGRHGAVTDDGSAARRIAPWAMAAMATNCYFISSGVLIIKDVWCVLIMSLLFFALVECKRLRNRTLVIGGSILAVALLLCTLIRPHMLLFMAMAMVVWMIAMPRRARLWMLLPAAIAVCLHLYAHTAHLSGDLIRDGEDINFFMHYNPERLNAYSLISPEYSNLDIPQKIIRLPFSAVVQFFIPLPMAFTRHIAFGPSTIWAHMSYPWYAVGGIFLFFCFFCFRRASMPLKAMAIFALLAWVATAFPTGGTVSRYCLPWLPAIAPPAAWVITSESWRSKTFARWAIAFTAAVALALVVITIFIHRYSPDGWAA